MPRLLRRCAAVLCAAAAIGAGAVPASAAEGVIRVDPAPVAGAPVRLADGVSAETALYRLLVDGAASVPAYGAALGDGVDVGAAYDETAWTAPAAPTPDPGPLTWIVRNSYPRLDLDRLRAESGVPGLTEEAAIAGTQAAVWHYTDGTDLAAAGGGNAPEVRALYDHLVAGAVVHGAATAPPTLSVTPERVEGADPAGPIGPLTVRTTAAGPVAVSVRGAPGVRLTDAEGAEVTRVADGAEFELRVDPSVPEGVATVYASAEDAAVAPGLLFTGRDGVQTRPLVTAGSAVAEATVAVTVDWSAAAPSPPPAAEAPSPSPAAPTESPSARPEPAATPSAAAGTDGRRPEGGLAFTGTWAGGLLAIGAGLLAVGAAAMYAGRRRR
jgi:TQXA domain-containing protein